MKEQNQVEVRAVSVEDAEEVCRICCDDLGYQCDKVLVTERINQLELEREAVFIALIDGEVAGFVHVEKYNTLYYEMMANILGLAVSSKYRKRGIGKALLEKAEHWAMANDISLMRLNSGKKRTDAHKFYRRLGYGQDKEQYRFIKRLD